MKHILDFVRNSNHINVILISVHHMHNLIRNSCVNNTVDAFNRIERFKNVEIINVVSDRDFYMQHEQHLNTRSKKKMLMEIICTIKSMLGKKMEPICVKWKNDKVSDMQERHASQGQESIN